MTKSKLDNLFPGSDWYQCYVGGSNILLYEHSDFSITCVIDDPKEKIVFDCSSDDSFLEAVNLEEAQRFYKKKIAFKNFK